MGFFCLVIQTKCAVGFIKGSNSSFSSFDVQAKLISIFLVSHVDIGCKRKPEIMASLFYFQRDSQPA